MCAPTSPPGSGLLSGVCAEAAGEGLCCRLELEAAQLRSGHADCPGVWVVEVTEAYTCLVCEGVELIWRDWTVHAAGHRARVSEESGSFTGLPAVPGIGAASLAVLGGRRRSALSSTKAVPHPLTALQSLEPPREMP
ncbi:hypothetical protein CB1_001197003 [Camelus ferus]|nr:hypothetical protein CB1_001197003 [Camelus ferus]